MSLIMLIFLLSVALYFLPSIVASQREKRDCAAIVLLNLFLGWTLVGWVIALVWAFTQDTAVASIQSINMSVIEHLREMETLLKAGTISQQEFDVLKAKLISNHINN